MRKIVLKSNLFCLSAAQEAKTKEKATCPLED
jgi:hypothetical protein